MRYCLFLLLLFLMHFTFYLKKTVPRGLERQRVFHRRIGGVCVISELKFYPVNNVSLQVYSM